MLNNMFWYDAFKQLVLASFGFAELLLLKDNLCDVLHFAEDGRLPVCRITELVERHLEPPGTVRIKILLHFWSVRAYRVVVEGYRPLHLLVALLIQGSEITPSHFHALGPHAVFLLDCLKHAVVERLLVAKEGPQTIHWLSVTAKVAVHGVLRCGDAKKRAGKGILLQDNPARREDSQSRLSVPEHGMRSRHRVHDLPGILLTGVVLVQEPVKHLIVHLHQEGTDLQDEDVRFLLHSHL
mmetsp:Transcript_9769/g.18402  ORF Transcript_9769/g.18402 Transcript_9769/m.18402 type:complete len:239 (-) Transcript_9769:1280-1996(-)